MCINGIIHDWIKVSRRNCCHSPNTWLKGETNEQAINIFTHQQKTSILNSMCTHIPLPTSCPRRLKSSFEFFFFFFFAANRTLNYDLVIIPFNTDISGSGHWVLATANFRNFQSYNFEKCCSSTNESRSLHVHISNRRPSGF